MTSQDLLDQIRELESFIDVCETQGIFSPRKQVKNYIQGFGNAIVNNGDQHREDKFTKIESALLKFKECMDVERKEKTLLEKEESNIHQKTDIMDYLPGQKTCKDDIHEEKSAQEEPVIDNLLEIFEKGCSVFVKDIPESGKLKEEDVSMEEHISVEGTSTKKDTVVEKDSVFKENIVPEEEKENCITEEEEKTVPKENAITEEEIAAERDFMVKDSIVPKNENYITEEKITFEDKDMLVENCMVEEEKTEPKEKMIPVEGYVFKEGIISVEETVSSEETIPTESSILGEDEETLSIIDTVLVENMGLVEITVPAEDIVPEENTEKKEKNMVSLERHTTEDDVEPAEERQSIEGIIFEKESIFERDVFEENIMSVDEDDMVSGKERESIKEYTFTKDNNVKEAAMFEKDVIEEATISEEKTPDEKTPNENVLEEDVLEENVLNEELSEKNSTEEFSSEKSRLMGIKKEVFKNNYAVNMVQRTTLEYYKPDEKVNHTTISKEYKPENKTAPRKIHRKAVLNDYKTVKKRNERSKVEPSISLLSLATNFSNVSTKNLRLSPLQRTSKSTFLRSPTLRKNEKTGTDSMLQRALSTRSSIYEHSRKNSVSSKISLRSVKSFRGQEEKTMQKYIPRSYEEMMRIPNVFERVSFYEKTLDICLKEESPITRWCDFVMARGKPDALEEGYTPMPRSDSLSDWSPCSSPDLTFGESISQFLKKASGSQATSLWNTASESKSSSSLSRNGSTYGSGIFGRSMSLLGLSRAGKANKLDKNKTFGPRVNAVNTKLSFSRSNSIRVVHSTFVKSSTSQTIGKDPLKDISKEQLTELNYMATILPHEDIRGLLDALNEANGDTMNAISIALNKNKSVRSHASNFD